MIPWNIVYDLGVYPPSWDFTVWLMNAEIDRRAASGGRMHVRFRPGPRKGFRPDGTPRTLASKVAIFQNVMRPALRLIGAVEQPAKPFDGPVQTAPTHLPVHAVQACRAGRAIPWWDVPTETMEEMRDFLNGRRPVVITLREATHWPTRNSNIEAWVGFARDSKEDIIFVRDTEKASEPLPGFETNPRAAVELLWRAALMESAKCNLLVANGPIGISLFGRRPWLMFGCLTPELPKYGPGSPEYWDKMLLGGNQYPWSSPKQQIVWEKDIREAIERAWAAWKEIP